ncbi:MAG: Ig-like domain-containing protein [Bifidobacteriaceae bacterium]|nr:Ig-like domain-containing protein [Bifidobacteriaceae bacterium]
MRTRIAFLLGILIFTTIIFISLLVLSSNFLKTNFNLVINTGGQNVRNLTDNPIIKFGPVIDLDKKEPNSNLTEVDKQKIYDDGVGSLKNGTRSVIVQLKDITKVDLQMTNPSLLDSQTGEIIRFANLSNPAINPDYKKAIKQKQSALISELDAYKDHLKLQRKFESFPVLTYLVDDKGLQTLKNNPLVKKVEDDRVLFPEAVLDEKPLEPNPITSMGGNASSGFGVGGKNYNGSGYAVAVLDTGVDKNHPKLAGKVITEACFSFVYPSSEYNSLCPNSTKVDQGVDENHDIGSAMPCGGTTCSHGTHVAGDATLAYQDIVHKANIYRDTNYSDRYAFNYDLVSKVSDGQGISGGARDASVVAIQVFSINYANNRIVTFNAAYLSALDWIYSNLDNRDVFSKPIAAINMSLGSPGGTPEACYDGTSAQRYIFTRLMEKGVAVMISSGNGWQDDYKNNVGSPSCSLGATSIAAANTSGDAFAAYSQNGQQTGLVAVGGSATFFKHPSGALACPSDSMQPCTIGYNSLTWSPQANQHNNEYEWVAMQGTSMASPYAAGIFTSLRSYVPQVSADDIINVMQATGYKLSDTRSGANTLPKPVISGNEALKALSNTGIKPVIRYFETSDVGIDGGSKVRLFGKVTPGSNCAINNKVGLVSLNSDGLFSVSDVISTDSFTLTCVNAQGDAYSSNTLDILNYKLLNNLSANPSRIHVNLGEKANINLQFSPNNASNKLVDYESENTAVAIVNNQGEISAVGVGSTTVDITSWTKTALRTTVNITVSDNSISVDSINILPKVDTVTLNLKQKFTALVLPNNATNKNVLWSSSNETIGVINQNGLFRALMPGETTITAFAKDGSGIYAAKLIKVITSEVNINIVDIKKDDFGKVEINKMYQRGYTTGCKYETHGNKVNTKYCPNDSVKRGQIAAFLYALAGAPAYTPPSESPFLDLKPNNIFYTQIMWGVVNGIWSGYSDGNFLPGKSITRSQFVATLWRFYGSPKPNFPVSNPFVDIKSINIFYEPILWAMQNNITTGYSGLYFKPNIYCNRAQVAVFLIKADDKYLLY